MKFVGKSTPAWTFSNTPKKVINQDSTNPFITSPTINRSKSRIELPGPAKYEREKSEKALQKGKGIIIPTASRDVGNTLLLTGLTPGPGSYEVSGDILKPLQKIYRKQKKKVPESERYNPVDPKKIVPDPGAYKIRKSFIKKGRGYTFGSNVKNKSMIEFRQSSRQKRLQKLPRRLKKKIRQDRLLDEDNVKERYEPLSEFYDVKYSQVWPDSQTVNIIENSSHDHKKKLEKRLSKKRRSLLRMIGKRKQRIIKKSMVMQNMSDISDSDDSKLLKKIQERMRKVQSQRDPRPKNGTFPKGKKFMPEPMGKDSPGPAAYTIENDTIKETIDYGKGAVLIGRNYPGKPSVNPSNHKSKLKGLLNEKDSSPGPGAYNLGRSLLKKNAIVLCSAEKESIFDKKYSNPFDIPGPGAYEIKSQFDLPKYIVGYDNQDEIYENNSNNDFLLTAPRNNYSIIKNSILKNNR